MKKVVINHKTTKFESNSQQSTLSPLYPPCCYQSQNYKIWKQFTTYPSIAHSWLRLLSITKLQNLKAIHNVNDLVNNGETVVINHKTTKFESNSQRDITPSLEVNSCYQSQNYKIWKQFTTVVVLISQFSLLLSITKLQNLKAIHNCGSSSPLQIIVVINHKTTKFESNSQLSETCLKTSFSCYQSQNYKIWKQFTTFGYCIR